MKVLINISGTTRFSGMRYIVILMVILYSGSCNLPGKLTIINLSGQYDSDNHFPSAETRIFNQDDSISALYLRFPLNELKYKKSKDSSFIFASFKIKVQLYDSYNTSNLVDSFSCLYTDTLTDKRNGTFEKEFRLKAPKGNNYLLTITLFDNNQGTSTLLYIPFLKKSKANRNDFQLLKVDNSVICNEIITDNGWIKIRLNNEDTKFLSVRYYQRDFPIAMPPFSLIEPKPFNYKADSTFILAVNQNETELFNLSKKGFYHFQSDTSGKEGITLYRFDDEFPLMKTAESIIPPVRYLTTSKEFDDLTAATDKKEAIDNFWLNLGGNTNRAKALIRSYYNRVTYANIFFTSYLEGWKTDRGMIYIIFGKPNVVYRSDYNESWVYGSKGSISSTKFDFIKVNNPFTDNDFSLFRLPVYKDSWYITIDNWRR